ncbi:NADPH:quinone reductase [Pseudonocardia sp. H11422]|uniref:NADPH:quinone reductase n=1 Tax=Pseudonocardia sp. H11422 TaxID=2835866 RepID=UPI001BDC60E9|nr:NADPH:quinone reductase [Pseudonocardia sp. H11422]
MRAALYDHPGPAREVLRVAEVERPEPAAGEVRVRLAVSGINPVDVKIRSGAIPWPIDGFQIPHHDGTGVIDAVGEGVDGTRVGERVWIWFAARRRWGTAAEWTVVPARQAVPLPEETSDELGASLGIPAMTAYHCLWLDGPPDGLYILVQGGAGAVGHFAVELGTWVQSHVAATVGGQDQEALAHKAGAEHIVDYRAPDAAARLKAFAPRMDRIIEVALSENLQLDHELSGPGTSIVTYNSPQPEVTLQIRQWMERNAGMRFVLLFGVPIPQLETAAREITVALSESALHELPVHRFPLDQIAEAHEAVEAGVLGKVLVSVR